MSEKNTKLIMAIDVEIAKAEAVIARFVEEFAKNPGYALDWSTPTFSAVAKRDVLRTIRTWAVGGVEFEKMAPYATETALRMSTNVEASTSATANLLANHTRAQWAEAVSRFGILGPAGPCA